MVCSLALCRERNSKRTWYLARRPLPTSASSPQPTFPAAPAPLAGLSRSTLRTGALLLLTSRSWRTTQSTSSGRTSSTGTHRYVFVYTYMCTPCGEWWAAAWTEGAAWGPCGSAGEGRSWRAHGQGAEGSAGGSRRRGWGLLMGQATQDRAGQGACWGCHQAVGGSEEHFGGWPSWRRMC